MTHKKLVSLTIYGHLASEASEKQYPHWSEYNIDIEADDAYQNALDRGLARLEEFRLAKPHKIFALRENTLESWSRTLEDV